jgi:hypothetical protein
MDVCGVEGRVTSRTWTLPKEKQGTRGVLGGYEIRDEGVPEKPTPNSQ